MDTNYYQRKESEEMNGKVNQETPAKVNFKEGKVDEGAVGEIYGMTLKTLCKPCSINNKTMVAEFFCSNCSEYQCKECSSKHKKFPFATNHEIIVLSQTDLRQMDDASNNFDMKGLELCTKHHEVVKFFCEDDQQLCCSTCAFLNHRKCVNVDPIDKRNDLNIPAFANLEEDLLQIGADAVKFKEQVKQQRRKLTSDTSAITMKIQIMQDQVTEQFQNIKKSVAKEMESFKKQAFKELDAKQNTYKSCIAVVEKSISDIHKVLEKGTPTQQFIAAQQLTDRIAELQGKFEKEEKSSKDIVVSFQFAPSIPLPPLSKTSLGKLSMKYMKTDDDSEYIQMQHKTECLTLLASIDLQLEDGDRNEPLYSGLDFLHDGRLIAVDNKNDKIILFNENLEKIASLDLAFKPQDLVILDDDEIAVTTGRERMVEFIRVTESNELIVSRSVKVTIEYSTICLMNDEDLIVGTIDDPKPVRILSVTGEEKELSVKFPAKRYPVRHSSCTYLKTCNKVVLTDRYAHAIYIYDIAKNTRVEVRDEAKIVEPRGATPGPNDSIFVCCSGSNSLVQISQSGEIMASHTLDMLYICRVSVSKDNRMLAVTNACVGEKKLQLFAIADIRL